MKEDILRKVREAISLLQSIESEITKENTSDDNSHKDFTILDMDLKHFLLTNNASTRLLHAIVYLSISEESWERLHQNDFAKRPTIFLGDSPTVRDLIDNCRPIDLLKSLGVGKKTLYEMIRILDMSGIDWK